MIDRQQAPGIPGSISIEEIYDGLDYDNSITLGLQPNGADILILEEDFQNGLKAIHNYVDRVLKTSEPAFRIVSARGRATAIPTRLSAVPTGRFITREFRETYELSEHVKIFLEAEDELHLRDEVALHTPLAKCWLRAGIAADLANELVALIRKKASSNEVRRRLAIRRYAAKCNFQRGAELIGGLFNARAKINVLRIDLEYRREHRPTLQQIKQDFGRFLNNRRRNSIFDTTLAVIWRLECGIRTGYHVHVMLFLNGHDALHDGFIAQRVGEYWVHDITDGRGRFHNCNYDKNRYRRLGIGMIHCSETEAGGKRDVLVNTVLRYLTTVDELARPPVPKGTRTFGTTRMPKPHSGRGRKRGSGTLRWTERAEMVD